MKTLLEIFDEAKNDYATTILNDTGYEACIYLGVKITKDISTDEVKIFDPSSVNYYIEVDDELYQLFYHKGWKGAVIDITLKKYKEKLERIRLSVSNEMNGNQSPKRLRLLKESRQQILNKYYKLTQKLNEEKKENI